MPFTQPHFQGISPSRPALLLLFFLGFFTQVDGNDIPNRLDKATQIHLENLDSQEWQLRESSQKWLIENTPRWSKVIPSDWAPESAEASWRWRRIGEVNRRLSRIRKELSGVDGRFLVADASRLSLEAGRAFEAAILTCLSDPDETVRSRAISILPVFEEGQKILRQIREEDSSPRVRRSLLTASRILDSDGGRSRILRQLASEEPRALRSESLRAARELCDPLLLPALEALDSENAIPDLDLSLTRVSIGGGTQLDAIEHLLVAGSYQQRHFALDALVSCGLNPPIDLLEPLLHHQALDLRHRALSLIERHGTGAAALSLLPLLKNRSLARWSIRQLVRLDASDYLGDIASALARVPIEDRCARIQSVDGELRLVPISISSP